MKIFYSDVVFCVISENEPVFFFFFFFFVQIIKGMPSFPSICEENTLMHNLKKSFWLYPG